jgi:hypothetical protein
VTVAMLTYGQARGTLPRLLASTPRPGKLILGFARPALSFVAQKLVLMPHLAMMLPAIGLSPSRCSGSRHRPPVKRTVIHRARVLPPPSAYRSPLRCVARSWFKAKSSS